MRLPPRPSQAPNEPFPFVWDPPKTREFERRARFELHPVLSACRDPFFELFIAAQRNAYTWSKSGRGSSRRRTEKFAQILPPLICSRCFFRHRPISAYHGNDAQRGISKTQLIRKHQDISTSLLEYRVMHKRSEFGEFVVGDGHAGELGVLIRRVERVWDAQVC